jgi:alkylation response protein AidB-like acyl-CoA dehydrogenase
MRYDLDPEDRLFREKVCDWLADNCPRDKRPTDGPESLAIDKAWQRKLYEAGWAGIAWPKEYGGLGLSLVQQMIWLEEYARFGAPEPRNLFVGLSHAGPTLIACGSEEQKQYHLPRILMGETVWCQGFSEPGAGSDLAGLRTRAVIDGDDLVVNGSKIWTSFAHHADWQELLVRTGSHPEKHHGITWVICDMKLPGIEIRPILDVVGSHHLNQVFYDDVRIPLRNVVGEVGGGWKVAMATLGFERGTGIVHYQVGLARGVERLIEQARRGPVGQRLIDDGEIAEKLSALRAEVAALRAMTYMNISRAQRGRGAGADLTMAALYHSELEKRFARLEFDLAGGSRLELSRSEGNAAYRYLTSFPWTIFGGTAQIRRNIIGERLLGLPRF